MTTKAAAARNEAQQNQDKERVDKDLDSTDNSSDTASSSITNEDDPFHDPGKLDEDTVVDPHGDRVSIPGTVVEPIRTAPVTFQDNRGVDRLVGGFDDGWEPAQVDPDPLLVAHNEARLAELEQAGKDRDKRQESLKTDAERESEKSV